MPVMYMYDVRDVVHIFGGHLAVMFCVCRGDGLSCWGS